MKQRVYQAIKQLFLTLSLVTAVALQASPTIPSYWDLKINAPFVGQTLADFRDELFFKALLVGIERDDVLQGQYQSEDFLRMMLEAVLDVKQFKAMTQEGINGVAHFLSVKVKIYYAVGSAVRTVCDRTAANRYMIYWEYLIGSKERRAEFLAMVDHGLRYHQYNYIETAKNFIGCLDQEMAKKPV